MSESEQPTATQLLFGRKNGEPENEMLLSLKKDSPIALGDLDKALEPFRQRERDGEISSVRFELRYNPSSPGDYEAYITWWRPYSSEETAKIKLERLEQAERSAASLLKVIEELKADGADWEGRTR